MKSDLENGTYYGVYTVVSNPAFAAGFVQGTGTWNNGSFTSSDLRNYNFETALVSTGSLSASYRAKSSFNGTVTEGASSVTFSSDYDASYEQLP